MGIPPPGGGEVLLSVRDDGVGIEKDQQEKVWQRFYQVDPSRSGGSGAGLAWPWYGRSPRPTADAWSWRASPAWAASLPSASPPTRFDRGQHVQAAGYPRRLDIYSQERQDRDIPKKHLKNLSSFHVDFM